MPNLLIIKDLSERKKITLRKIAEVAELTEAGLHGAIKKGDMKLSTIDKIAHLLNVDLSIFSDFPPVGNSESGIVVDGHNYGNIAGKNLIQVSLPETGQQKIIKPDGTTIIEALSLNNEGRNEDFSASNEKQVLLDKIKLQEQLIDSLQDQLTMYKNKKK